MMDCVVIGGGAAGLATSVALGQRGVQHVVLEAGQAAQTWATQRWDSFRLNTPGWTTSMLGDRLGDAYLTSVEVVTRLSALAATAPIRVGIRVLDVTPACNGYRLRTPDEEIHTRTVVVATGDENVPRIPRMAATLPSRIVQLHTADYHSPKVLPDGAVLVVGSGQSGAQICDDLLAAGRRVLLGTSPVGHVPVRHRGLDTFELLHASGFFDQTLADLPDPAVMEAPQPILAPAGKPLSLHTLARDGATLTGRLVAVDDQWAVFDDSLAANMAAGDAFAGRVRAMLDALISRTERTASIDQTHEFDRGDRLIVPNPPTAVRLSTLGAVVWCTGFTGDFSWADSAMLDPSGRPRHNGCAGTLSGLWYVGLRWLTHRASGTLPGIPKDAATVAAAVAAHLNLRTTGG